MWSFAPLCFVILVYIIFGSQRNWPSWETSFCFKTVQLGSSVYLLLIRFNGSWNLRSLKIKRKSVIAVKQEFNLWLSFFPYTFFISPRHDNRAIHTSSVSIFMPTVKIPWTIYAEEPLSNAALLGQTYSSSRQLNIEKNAKHTVKAQPVSHPLAAPSTAKDGWSQTWPSISSHLNAELRGNSLGGGMQTFLWNLL